MMLKRAIAAMLVAVSGLIVLPASPGLAGAGLTILGTDPSLDATPGGDLTSIGVMKAGSDLHIQITLANSIPVAGTYGDPTGIQWAFMSRGKTYAAEGYPDGTGFGFTLFEVTDDAFREVETLEGDFDTVAGVMNMYVPLKTIGARKGTIISGAGENDVDVHVHAGPQTYLPDTLTTTKSFKVS